MECLKLFTDTRCNNINDDLLQAAKEGNLKGVESILNNCHDTADVNKANAYGRTPLILAADRGHFAIVELLLKQKDIRVNLVDKEKRRLFFAVPNMDIQM